jgi:hypothetical protein
VNADVEKAVEFFESLATDHKPSGWPAVRMDELTLVAKALRDQEAEIARLDASESRLIDERDRAQDALQRAHIELGGDGEWTCKMGAAADYPPDSGDLHDDVPALASEVRARAEKAEALLRETLRYLDPRHYPEIIKRITAHLGGEQ